MLAAAHKLLMVSFRLFFLVNYVICKLEFETQIRNSSKFLDVVSFSKALIIDHEYLVREEQILD